MGDGLPQLGFMKETNELQSSIAVDGPPEEETKVVQNENLVFEDAMAEEVEQMPTLLDETYDEDADEAAHLANYLSRPVNIQRFTWNASTPTIGAVTSPWHAYFSDSKIQPKVKNFGRFHGKLHLKFVMNASPFYYGAIRAVYEPRRQFLRGSTSVNELVPASQLPGVWLTPQSASSAELVCPFIHENNWIDPMNAAELAEMGRLSFYVYSALSSANGAVGFDTTVSVYAWIDDPVLVAPTSKELLQSALRKDGVVSGLADKVATVTGKLGGIPFLGSYASTASAAAKAVGTVAAAFGFSNAPVTKDVDPMVPKAFHAFANCETSMPNDKLCIDPKNEVPLDNSVAGTDSSDPLALANVLRESYIGQFTWSNQSPEASLMTFPITPSLEHKETVTQGSKSGTLYHFTPSAYVARMFRLWRGSIIYRFQFVKTKYHRGRIRISWDPIVDNTSNYDTETTCFTKLVDLDEDDFVEFEVPFKAKSNFLNTATATPMWNTSGSSSLLSVNGYLNVRVQNVLSGPVAAPSITVLVFQRPGSDFQFAQPNELPLKFTPHELQSSVVIDGKSGKSGEYLATVSVGEHVQSLRPLVHRTSLSMITRLGNPGLTASGTIMASTFMPRMPWWYGVFSFGPHQMTNPATGSTANGCFCIAHPLSWVAELFVGYRGSIVLSANICGATNNCGRRLEYARLERYPGDVLVVTGGYPNPTNRNQLAVANKTLLWNTFSAIPTTSTGKAGTTGNGQRGATLTKEVTQSALSAVSPQYQPHRFRVYVPSDVGGSGVNAFDNFRLDTCWTTETDLSGTVSSPWAEFYYAGGVDFQPVFFGCTPALFDWGEFTPI